MPVFKKSGHAAPKPEAASRLVDSLIAGGWLKTPMIITAFRAIDRADFVLPEHRAKAYGNYPLPIGAGQTISQPLTVAFMLELLDPEPGEKILDIGSGSGWTTALLASIAAGNKKFAASKSVLPNGEKENGAEGIVYAVERIPELYEFGKKNLEKYGFLERGEAVAVCRDGSKGFFEGAPFDKILAGAVTRGDIPHAWREQVRVGGKIVAPVNDGIRVYKKKAEHRWEEKTYPGFVFVPLVLDSKGEDNSGAREDESARENKPAERENNFPYKAGTILNMVLFFSLFPLILAMFAGYEIYISRSSFETPKKIVVPQGAGLRDIAEILKREKVIRSKFFFLLYAVLRNHGTSLKAGHYLFVPGLRIFDVERDLAAGKNRERVIIIPEGWTNGEIAEYLEKGGITKSENFFSAANAAAANRFLAKFSLSQDGRTARDIEGYLFPDTYRIFEDSHPEEIVRKMLANFDKKVRNEFGGDLSKSGRTLFEIITMASMIEREVVSDQDRRLVSGILWKRLERGIPLQVDATITYIKKKRGIESGVVLDNGKIDIADTKIESPYNTYKYKGLPQGPIGNPGLSAIKAALYPTPSPYLYYLSAPDGKTIFSRTLEEHNAAKRKFLR